MFYAKRIRMKAGCSNSNNLQEIADIYVDGCDKPGFFPKETLHDHLKSHPGTIKVNIAPFPDVIPAVSSNGEKFVRSSPNQSTRDNLLNLPRV